MKNIYILPIPREALGSNFAKIYEGPLPIKLSETQVIPESSFRFEFRRGGLFGLNSYIKPQYIYITSDEEIKSNCWVLNIVNGSIYKTYNGKNFQNDTKNEKWRKIILTTDAELIADGVQAIPDDFLEWFVKNHHVEFVKTNWYEGIETGHYYKIIIPKEEPKQKYKYIGECKGNNDDGCFMDSCGHNCGCFTRVLVEEPKQETLEEVNQSHVEQNKYMFIDKNFIIWLFNNYKKNNGTLFYHKFDNSNVKTYYYLEDLLKIYNEKS